jgi:hypothetical protein
MIAKVDKTTRAGSAVEFWGAIRILTPNLFI